MNYFILAIAFMYMIAGLYEISITDNIKMGMIYLTFCISNIIMGGMR